MSPEQLIGRLRDLLEDQSLNVLYLSPDDARKVACMLVHASRRDQVIALLRAYGPISGEREPSP